MAEFQRSRLTKKSDEEITKKTIVLGLVTLVTFGLLLVFGLPLLIKFSIFLGDLKSRGAVEVKEKILPPTPPRIILPYEATNSGEIAIKGVAEKGVKVELLKNDVLLGREEVDENGEFEFKNVSLDRGESLFTAVAISDQGGNSEPSAEIRVLFDDVAPTLTLSNPVEDSIKVDYADFDVVGQSERGVSVLINNRVAMVDDDGKFKLKLQLNTGKNDVEVVVRDNAGNETRKKIVITYDI